MSAVQRKDRAMQVFLETRRLLLRRLTEADADDLFELDSDSEVMLEGFGFWAAIERSTGDFVGWFEFRPNGNDDPGEVELGYRLKRSAWGKGYATEGSRALIRKSFTELRVHRVVAQTMAVNTASRRVMEKTGLTLERTFYRDWPDPIEGAEHGEVEYALHKADWELIPRGATRVSHG